MKKPNRWDLFCGEHGASLVETAVLVPLFVLLLCSAVDFGRAFFLADEIAGAAQAGAIYGSQSPTDTAGMKTVAQDDAPDVPGLSAGTPTSDCECADGTNYTTGCTTTPTCAGGLNVVYRVKVTVTATYKPLFRWPGIPSSIPFSSTASMRAQ